MFEIESYPRYLRCLTESWSVLFIYITHETYVRFYTKIFISYTMNKISTFEVLPWRPDLYDESNKIVLTHLHLYTKVYHPKSLDVQVIIISEISLKHSFFVLGPQTEVLNENRTLSFSTFSKCTSLFIRSMKTVKKTCIYKRLGFINPLVRTWNDGWQSDTRLTQFHTNVTSI